MHALAPDHADRQASFASQRMSSVLVVDGASLSKRNGGGVRSRIVLETLQDLGDVHVIALVTSPRHISRVGQIEGVASQQTIVTAPVKKSGSLRTLFSAQTEAAPGGKESVLAETLAGMIATHPDIQLIALRYFKTWRLSGLQSSQLLQKLCVWLDLDDREDRITYGKLASSRSWLLRKLAPRLAATVKRDVERAAQSSDVCSLASDSDLADFAPGANVIALPNVVPQPSAAQIATAPSASQSILFVGAYSWPPNVDAIEWFVTQCWPAITAAQPDAKLHVVGSGKRSDRDTLARKHQTAAGIEWHHDVPELDSFYSKCRMVISPVRQGSGSKIKVIEAAAYARPIVATPHSARGLHPAISAAMQIEAAESAFAKACVHYLSSPEQADADGAQLLAAQKQHHSIDTFKRVVFQALRSTLPPGSFPAHVASKYELVSQQPNEVQT